MDQNRFVAYCNVFLLDFNEKTSPVFFIYVFILKCYICVSMCACAHVSPGIALYSRLE